MYPILVYPGSNSFTEITNRLYSNRVPKPVSPVLYAFRVPVIIRWVARGFATWKIRHKEDSPHSRWVGGWGQGVGLGVGVGGLKSGGLGSSRLFNPNPRSPNSPTLTPTPLRPQPITVVWRIFHIGTVANVCPTLTLKFAVTFVCLTRCVANL